MLWSLSPCSCNSKGVNRFSCNIVAWSALRKQSASCFLRSASAEGRFAKETFRVSFVLLDLYCRCSGLPVHRHGALCESRALRVSLPASAEGRFAKETFRVSFVLLDLYFRCSGLPVHRHGALCESRALRVSGRKKARSCDRAFCCFCVRFLTSAAGPSGRSSAAGCPEGCSPHPRQTADCAVRR